MFANRPPCGNTLRVPFRVPNSEKVICDFALDVKPIVRKRDIMTSLCIIWCNWLHCTFLSFGDRYCISLSLRVGWLILLWLWRCHLEVWSLYSQLCLYVIFRLGHVSWLLSWMTRPQTHCCAYVTPVHATHLRFASFLCCVFTALHKDDHCTAVSIKFPISTH